MLKDVLKDARGRMQGAVDSLDHDLDGFRTGRASTSLVDRIMVDYYGTPTPMNQISTITAPEPRLIAVRPWDRSALTAIEKAILASDLGLTPSNDGQLIRLPIPQLTEERREELIRLVSKRVEEARIAIRNVRRDIIHEIDQLELPEDESYTAKEEAQSITDSFIAEADKHAERKSKEIREV
jgi:ribosome recycling factor